MPEFSVPQISKLRPNQIAIIMGVIGAIAIAAVVFWFFRKPPTVTGPPVTLTVWGTEPRAAMNALLTEYMDIRSNVTITYEEINPAGYNDTILNALASGQGPDVFTLPSSDIGSYKDKLSPAPAEVTPLLVSDRFPKAVESDVIDSAQVYGLPLSLDTLHLIYNRDLLDGAGITSPPATWDALVSQIESLRSIDFQGQVTQSAIALGGTAQSVPYSDAILSLLMLQNGASLSNQAHTLVDIGEQGERALLFYSQFANPNSNAYTWSDQLGSAPSLFAEGKVAMLIGYPGTLEAIRSQNPFIDARLAPVPQTDSGTPRSFGHYPLLVASKQGQNALWAWDFIQSTTLNSTLAGNYATASNRSPALRELIDSNIQNPETKISATQSLQARSWFQWDGNAVAREFDRAISEITNGVFDSNRAARTLEQRLRALIR